MSIKSLVRRTAAVTAATTLISTGGAATGMLASSAFADPAIAPVITSFSPTQWDNRSAVSMQIFGSNFDDTDPSGLLNDYVEFAPVNPDPTNEVASFVSNGADFSSSSTVMTVSVDLSMAPPVPGGYKIIVHHADGPGGVPAGLTSNILCCFNVYGFGPANAISSKFGPSASNHPRGPGPLDITGSNISIGATVSFIDPVTGQPDPGLTFAQGNPGNTNGNARGTDGADGVSGTGYLSSTSLQGNYTPVVLNGTKQFRPGIHQLRIVNADGNVTGQTAQFAQPYFTQSGLAPDTIGVGAQGTTLTITGQGIIPGSSIAIDSHATNGTPPAVPACSGVTVGQSTVSNPDVAHPGTFTTISAPVSIASCIATSATSSNVTINGPDGAYFVGGAINIGQPPTFTAIQSGFDTLGQGAKVGYGADGKWAPGTGVTITGSRFEGVGRTDPAKMVKFDLGPGVTVVTRAVTSGGAAEVTIDVTHDAATGDRAITVTNPDGGSVTVPAPTLPTDPTTFTVAAGPQITSVSPGGFQPSQAGTTVTVTGSFVTTETYAVSVSPSTGIATTAPTSVTATTLKFNMSTVNAPAGLKDLTITDNANHGQFDCMCIGIDSLSVVKINGAAAGNPASTANSGPAVLTFQDNTPSGPTMDQINGASTITLTHQIDLSGNGQGPIQGTILTPGAANSHQASATFDLTNVATGTYNVRVVLDPATVPASAQTVWTCTGCFTVSLPSGTSFAISGVTPNTAGQGATNRLLTFTGTGITKGMSVSIGKVTTHDVTFVDNKTFTARIDVAPDATTGSDPATITAGDGTTATQAFTINPAPTVTAFSPAAYGQGASLDKDAKPLTVTVTGGQGTLQTGAAMNLGPGITVTNVVATTGTAPLPVVGCPPSATDNCMDTATGTIVIGQSAATGLRDLVFTNPDGGQTTFPKAFTVNPGPTVTSVTDETGSPLLKPDGLKHTITVSGSGFSTTSGSTSTLAIVASDGKTADPKIAVANVTVVSASKITADVTVATDDVRGVKVAGVFNPTDDGYGDCLATPGACPVVGAVPGSPAPLTLTPLAQAIKATWHTPTSDGGIAITGYHLKIVRGPLVVQELTVPASPLTYTFTGLSNGATYTVSVYAVNAAVSTGHTGPVAIGSAVAGLHPALTIVQSAKSITYGARETLSGRLVYGATGLAGRTISLSSPINGHFLVTTTSSTGAWTLSFVPTSSFTGHVTSLQDSTYAPATSPNVTVAVASRVTWKAPPNRSSSSSSSTLTLAGSVAPSKAGRVVYLYRFVGTSKVLVAKLTLNKYSQFALSFRPARGTWVFRIYVPALTGNAAAWSVPLTLFRT